MRPGPAILGLVLALASCGWHTGGLAPEGAGTVGVEVFSSQEQVFERDVEPALHRELSKAVSDLSGLPLVAASEADLVVRGRILEVRRRSGIRSPDNRLLETGYRLVASADLVDRKTGKVLREAPARVWSGYALLGAGAEAGARDRALQHVAETLTLELFRPGRVPPAAGDAEARDGQEGAEGAGRAARPEESGS